MILNVHTWRNGDGDNLKDNAQPTIGMIVLNTINLNENVLL